MLIDRYLHYRSKTTEGYRYTIENPLEIVKRNGFLKLSNGQIYPFNKNNKDDVLSFVLFLLENGIVTGSGTLQWKYYKDEGVIETHQGIRFSLERFHPTIMAETFLYDIHYAEHLENRVIVQAGGFTGDTALYYASLGAKVYSFEPDINSYNLGLKNIGLNPKLLSKITFRNIAIGEDGFVDFPLSDSGGGDNSLFYNGKGKTFRVKSQSISKVLSEYEIESPYLLDLDIKGEEFTIINDEAIKKFERVRIEYSPYLLKSKEASLILLKDKLREQGFTDFRIFKHNYGRWDLMNIGTLEASRKDVVGGK